jgi:hypothetical protein
MMLKDIAQTLMTMYPKFQADEDSCGFHGQLGSTNSQISHHFSEHSDHKGSTARIFQELFFITLPPISTLKNVVQ